MKGSKKVIEVLNAVLINELLSIHQYFLHARILDSWGLDKLGSREKSASIEEMHHADELIQRLLFLDSIPQMDKSLTRIHIGKDVKEILRTDLKLEQSGIPTLKSGIQLCEADADFVSRSLLNKILDSEEAHIDWLETQLSLIAKMGYENYLQSSATS